MTDELLRQQKLAVAGLYATERWAADNSALLQPFLHIFNQIPAAAMKKISALQSPGEVLAVVDMPDEPLSSTWLSGDICLYVDGLQDPGNLGAIWRIADWFGFPALFCSPDSVDAYNPKVIQASMGAFLRVPTLEIALETLLERHPGLPVLGAAMDGLSVFDWHVPQNGVLVIGQEGRGLSPGAEAMLTQRLTIPRHPAGGAESLNAAVATGIFAATIRRVQSVKS